MHTRGKHVQKSCFSLRKCAHQVQGELSFRARYTTNFKIEINYLSVKTDKLLKCLFTQYIVYLNVLTTKCK